MRAAEHLGRHRGEGGYVLVTVLAALVLLALLAARLDMRVQAAREAHDRWGQWQLTEQVLVSARERVLFTLTTRPLGPLGFGTGAGLLRVDGRAYALADGAHVSVLDLRGLISVAYPQSPVLREFLRRQGVVDRDLDGLLDKLADYSDLDSLRRLNGGEAAEYAAAGLPPPRDDWPLSPHELRAVLGWHERPALASAAIDATTAIRDGWINPNTAPPVVLRALPGASDEGVAALLALREQRHIASAAELQAASGIVLADDPVAFYPGAFYRIRLWRPGSPGGVEYTAMLSPDAPSRPWLVLELRQFVPSTPTHAEPEAQPFPLDADAPPVVARSADRS
jgi:hypothetical protein